MSDSASAASAPVIVIDLQIGMFDGRVEPPIHDAANLVARARRVIAGARHTGRKVAFVRRDAPADDPLALGEPGWPKWPSLGQVEDEPTFGKTAGDAFSIPELGGWEAQLGAGELILLGAQTDPCVAASVRGAAAIGLAMKVVSDVHGAWDYDGETTGQIIARYNAAFAAARARLVSAAAMTGG